MSAFVVPKRHIDAMLRAGLVSHLHGDRLRWPQRDPSVDPNAWQDRAELTGDTADAVGTMLTDTCVRSVRYRYPDTDPAKGGDPERTPGTIGQDFDAPYTFPLFDTPLLPPVAILKMIDCYEYQSCEHPEWQTSEARQFCDALRSFTIGRLPGYEAAPWDYSGGRVAEPVRGATADEIRAYVTRIADMADRRKMPADWGRKPRELRARLYEIELEARGAARRIEGAA